MTQQPKWYYIILGIVLRYQKNGFLIKLNDHLEKKSRKKIGGSWFMGCNFAITDYFFSGIF